MRDSSVYSRISVPPIQIEPRSTYPATLIKDIQEEKADILSAVKTEEDIKECVRDVFNDIIVEKAEKLVIFIDELDRCKPSFAIEMLERIKHYFDDERIIFVVSLNKEQLIHTISNYYGSEFYKNSIESIPRNVGDTFSSDKIYLIIFEVVVVLLDMVDAKEKKAFLEGKSNILIELMPKIESYKKYILRVFGIDVGEDNGEQLDEKYKLVQEVYQYAFGRDTEEYFKGADISRNLKEICINACNGLRL